MWVVNEGYSGTERGSCGVRFSGGKSRTWRQVIYDPAYGEGLAVQPALRVPVGQLLGVLHVG